jgi:acylphosphatase
MVSSSLYVFRFVILVFHLKQEHEEGQRFLHYLQQKKDPLARFMYVRVRSQETSEKQTKSECYGIS